MGAVKKSLKLHNFLWQNIKLAKYAYSYINRLYFQLEGRVRGGVSKWTALRPALRHLFNCYCLGLWGFLLAKASCFLTSWILCHGPSCLGDGVGPPPLGPGRLSWLHACMWLIGLMGRAARQSHSSLLTFLSFPHFSSNSDLHHLAWVHQLCYHRGPGQALAIRRSAQLLMFLRLSLLTLPVIPMTINSTTPGGEVPCPLPSRLSWGYAVQIGAAPASL